MSEANALAKRKYFDYNAVPERETRAFLRKKADLGKQILKRTAQGIWEMGQLLSEVKERLPHGEFGLWVDAEFGLKHNTANGFMRVYRQFQNVNFSQFEVAPSVLYLLAAPSVDNDTRDAAVQEIQAGNIRTVAEAKAFVAPKPAPIPKPEPQVLEAEVVEESESTDPLDNDDALSVSTEPTAQDEAEKLRQRAAAATVVRDTMTPREEAAVDLAVVRGEDDDMSDAEWLMSLPLFRHLVSTGNSALLLKADALGWRTLDKARAFSTFKHHAERALNFKAATTPLAHLLQQAASVPHPRDWGGCVKCRAKGCTDCHYTGYALKGGLSVEQLEARP